MARLIGVNFTGGRVIAVPFAPVWVIESSHSAGFSLPSFGFGKLWAMP